MILPVNLPVEMWFEDLKINKDTAQQVEDLIRIYNDTSKMEGDFELRYSPENNLVIASINKDLFVAIDNRLVPLDYCIDGKGYKLSITEGKCYLFNEDNKNCKLCNKGANI